jgi:hypothetical protein
MSLVQNDHVIQAFAANTPNGLFDVGFYHGLRGAIPMCSIPMCRTRCRNEALWMAFQEQ